MDGEFFVMVKTKWALFKDGKVIFGKKFAINDIIYTENAIGKMSDDHRLSMGIYAVRDEDFDQTKHTCSGYDYHLIGDEIVGKPLLTEIPVLVETKEDIELNDDRKRREQALLEMDELDRKAPRGLEDLYEAMGDTRPFLPSTLKTIFNRKKALRAIISATNYIENKSQ